MDSWQRRSEQAGLGSIGRADILREARNLKDLPANIQRANGLLFDCGWWILQILRKFYLTSESYDHKGERIPAPAEVKAICDRILRRKDVQDLRPADVVMMRYGRVPRHVALVIPHPNKKLAIMHYSIIDQQLVEESLDLSLQYRIVQAYNIPGLID